jgi:MFS family permease
VTDPPADSPPARSRLRALAVDTGPLRRHRDFRLLWFGELISETGNRVTVVAVFVQVFALTHSAAAVGLVGLAQLVPLAVSTLAAGPVIDRADRRRILLLAQGGYLIGSGVLLAGAIAGHPPVLIVYAGVAIKAAMSGITSPTRSAMVPRVVGRADLSAALALNQVMWNSSQIVGPALGGFVITQVGLAAAYAIDLASFAASIIAALLMRPMPPAGDIDARPPLAALREGFAYLAGDRVVRATFVADLIAMIFGMPRALFPILAVTRYHRGPGIVGLLFSAVAVGALASALTAGWVTAVRRQGRAVLWAVAVWGAGITLFGVTGQLVLGIAMLALAGAADVISAVFRGTILQSRVPDELRGRISAVHILVVVGGPSLGDLEAGLVAQWFGAITSVVSGGLACIAGVAIIARAIPEFSRYDAHADVAGPSAKP